MDKPKTTTINSKPSPVCNIPPHIDAGVWRIVFLFLGINKDLARCRLVCQKWRVYFHQCIEILLLDKKRALVTFKENWEKIIAEIPLTTRLDIETALKLRVSYETCVTVISNKYSSFQRVFNSHKPKGGPMARYTIMAVMHLITEKKNAKRKGGRLNWSYCKEVMLSRDFLKSIRETTHEKITKGRIEKFMDVVETNQITVADLARESTQALYLMEWAFAILEYKNFVKHLNEGTKDALNQLTSQDRLEKEIALMEKLLQF